MGSPLTIYSAGMVIDIPVLIVVLLAIIVMILIIR